MDKQQAFQCLENIQNPAALRQLDARKLPEIAEAIREVILSTLNTIGGHLGAGLGAVELTLALHYSFNTPQDRIVWDVGHQAYPHKILTERLNKLSTIRQKDGLAPFPAREESIYDTFGVGHSSTSIGAALGMSLAAAHQGTPRHAIAVIGDGGMTAGMAFEALNHAGHARANLIVVLNDNDMSISGNVGALSNYFARIVSSKMYAHVKAGGKKILQRIPPVWEFARRTESHLRGIVLPGTLFEELGFNYLGPIDGHDLPSLLKTFDTVKSLSGPQLVHVITQKGKGFAPAEKDPIGYHAVSKGFYCKEAIPTPTPTAPTQAAPAVKKLSYSAVFGQWLTYYANQEPRLVAITPAMCEGSAMVEFAKQFPERFYDVGIAEQHAVTVGAGFACEGMRPVVAIYSTFLQRAYDQLVHDVAIQNLPVLFAIDRAGLVPDGPTHSGNFDLSFLRCIPNLLIMTPSDENECWQMLTTGMHYQGPACIRYPRENGLGLEIQKDSKPLPLGKALVRRQGQRVALLAFGPILHKALVVGERLDATVVDMRFVKPLDEALIIELAKTHELIVTLEENVVAGGAGSAVSEVLQANHLHQVAVLHLGLPDYFIQHGTLAEMYQSCQLDQTSIFNRIQEKISHLPCKAQAFQVNS